MCNEQVTFFLLISLQLISLFFLINQSVPVWGKKLNMSPCSCFLHLFFVYRFLLVIILDVSPVESSHFRGGIITWRPVTQPVDGSLPMVCFLISYSPLCTTETDFEHFEFTFFPAICCKECIIQWAGIMMWKWLFVNGYTWLIYMNSREFMSSCNSSVQQQFSHVKYVSWFLL